MAVVISQAERENLEKEFWEKDPDERPGARSIGAVINKMGEAPVFFAELNKYANEFGRSADILELGGGQLWSSCIAKAKYPNIRITGSDISQHAVQSSSMWEAAFDVKLDAKITCTSYDIPVPDQSFDLVFAFQAAHHFGDHDTTLKEANRILRPGGALLYAAEPVCSKLTYGVALRRVNRMRPVVQEDLLILSDMKRLALHHNFDLTVQPRAEILGASTAKVAYYTILKIAPQLRSIMPNAASLLFVKPL